jgi:hypothetical protein
MRIVSTTILSVCFCLAVTVCAREKPIVFKGDTVINSTVEIPASASCIIMPGTTIRFSGYYAFIVKGACVGSGTAARPIRFTGVGRERGSRERPCWAGLQISGAGASAVFRHCRIEGAFKNVAWESSPLFDSCEFAGNHYALYCAKKSSPHVRAGRFYRNTYGLIADFAAPLLTATTISENIVGVHLQPGSRFIAGNNVIINNETNILADSSLGKNNYDFSTHYLWELMRQMY